MSENSKYLIEGITKDILVYLIEENNLKLSEALNIVYNSDTYEKLTNLKTGLYFESSDYVYDFLKNELKFETKLKVYCHFHFAVPLKIQKCVRWMKFNICGQNTVNF